MYKYTAYCVRSKKGGDGDLISLVVTLLEKVWEVCVDAARLLGGVPTNGIQTL